MQGVFIKSDRLKRQQEIHGLTVIIFPFVGSLVAFVLALQFGVNPVDVVLLIVMYLLTMMGVTVGFHRYFAHSAFQTHPYVRILLAILGSMAAEGPLNYWVATHRRHHKYSDLPGDPHSPYVKEQDKLDLLKGIWHSHMGWTFNHEITNTFTFARELLKDPVMTKISQTYYYWMALGMLLPAIAGGLISQTWLGFLTGFLWGGCVRIFLQHHLGFWTVGSLAHLIGDRPYITGDQSRNNLWVALFTGGEWHNNHHAFPNAATHGFEWWQVDAGAWVILALKQLGLVWDLKQPTSAMLAAKKAK